MKTLSRFISLFITLFFGTVCFGQIGIITTYATAQGDGIVMDQLGNIYLATNGEHTIKKISPSGVITIIAGTSGVSGYSGDGGPATAATLNFPQGLAIDASGNIFVADFFNHVIRKINVSGVITTVVGTSTAGYGGDGGPATAAQLSWVQGITIDQAGNLYLSESDMANATIRKVDATGVITKIAGQYGAVGFNGDGGPATAALFSSSLAGITTDAYGNIYVSDESNNRIRKIDASGVITTFAGNGLAGYAGDGGPAASGEINAPEYINTDLAGNVLFSDQGNVVRRVNIAGIISTFAGTGLTGYTGDGGPANLATLYSPAGIVIDEYRNVYISDAGNNAIRKVSLYPFAGSDSFSVYLDTLCGGVHLTTVTTSTSTLNLHTYFGDQTQDVTGLTVGLMGTENAGVTHTYNTPGTYSIKEVLFNGSTPIDSAMFSYTYLMCNTIFLSFYHDANGNCNRDSTEPYSYLPVFVEVDSNGVSIDTVSVTTGLYYNAYGNIGDVYSFKIVSAPTGFTSLCMPGGVVSDTLDSLTNNVRTNSIGFSCTPSSSFDIATAAHLVTGRHMATGNIIAYNNSCTAEDAVITMNFDSKYTFESSSPAPASVVGNTVTWNYNSLTAYSTEPYIQFTLTVPGTWLTPGDTISSDYYATPTSGDSDPSNNNCVRVDTVKSSYDPNEMSVTPAGNIAPGTNLEYTINFENTGNDTAHNIYVMDTLSDNVDVSSIRTIAASAVMNIATFRNSGHNIVKFDFAGINLLDSSHHNQCNGMVIFTINTRTGLVPGTTIFNHAGIFFDDNPVVMTNAVEDIIPVTTAVAAINSASKFSVFPNPATEEVTIYVTNDKLKDEKQFTITNTVGQILMQRSFSSAQTTLNISSLPAGLYYLTLKGAFVNGVQKFVKE